VAADTMFVLALVAVFVAWVGFMAVHSRRQQSPVARAQPGGEPGVDGRTSGVVSDVEPQSRATSARTRRKS
jgi:hypothetical protein